MKGRRLRFGQGGPENPCDCEAIVAAKGLNSEFGPYKIIKKLDDSSSFCPLGCRVH